MPIMDRGLLRVLVGMAANPVAPPEILPTDVITALARDTEASVRAAAARHRRIPVPVLETLLTDDDPVVVEAAGANPVLPVDRMRALLDRAGL